MVAMSLRGPEASSPPCELDASPANRLAMRSANSRYCTVGGDEYSTAGLLYPWLKFILAP